MFLWKARRARVVTAATLALAVLLPLHTASADYWYGTRLNGTGSGGYYITSSARVTVDGVDYEQLFRNSAQKWRLNSITLSANMLEFSEWVFGNDKYYTQPVLMIKGKEDKETLALTKLYGTTPDPNIRQLKYFYPDNQGTSDKHGNGCFHDRTWEMATVTIYTKTIKLGADLNGISTQDEATYVSVHEIGHTLKMAHAQYTYADGTGNGTENKNDNYRAGETASVMQPYDTLPLPLDLQAYDKRQIKAKWGL